MNPLLAASALSTFQQWRATAQGWSHRLALAGAYGLVAFVLVLTVVNFVAVALFIWLADLVPAPVAALIVAIVFALLAGLAALLARHAIKRGRGGTGSKLPALPGPEQALNVLGGANTGLVTAIVAGVIGGLVSSQLRARAQPKRERD